MEREKMEKRYTKRKKEKLKNKIRKTEKKV